MQRYNLIALGFATIADIKTVIIRTLIVYLGMGIS